MILSSIHSYGHLLSSKYYTKIFKARTIVHIFQILQVKIALEICHLTKHAPSILIRLYISRIRELSSEL